MSTWFLVTVFTTIRTFYLTMVEAFIVWGFTAIFMAAPVDYVKAFIVIAIPTFILSLFRVTKWFKVEE